MPPRLIAFIVNVPEKEGNRLGSLNTKCAQTAPSGFLCAYTFARAYGWQWWGAFGLPVIWYRSSYPAICRPPPIGSGKRLDHYQTEYAMISNWLSTSEASPKSAPLTQDNSATIPTPTGTSHQERWLTVGLYPEPRPQTPWIRLRGQWLKNAGFTPQTRVRVKVMTGCLVITAE